MATSKKFSELPAASAVGNDDLFAIAHEDALAETGYVSQKLTAAQAGQKVNGDTEYPTSLPSFPENGQNPFAALEKLNADIEGLYPVNTASGSIANFTTSLAKPLTALTSTIVAQQASGTPTPSSPLPISGFSSVKFEQTGKNLWQFGDITQSDNNVPFSLKAGTYNLSGTKDSSGNPSASVRFYYIDDTSEVCQITNSNSYSNSVTLTKDVYKINIYISSDAVRDIQLELGNEKTTFEAYTGNTFTVALGDTYYGGILDAKNGKLTVTHKLYTFNGTEDWVIEATHTFSCNGPARFYGDDSQSICDKMDFWGNGSTSQLRNNLADGQYGFVRTNYRIWACFDDCSTVAEIQAKTTGMTILYQRLAAEEIDITENNFTTIAGVNNIFSDCGVVSVGFKQGIQEYIDAQIAATQALILNS